MNKIKIAIKRKVMKEQVNNSKKFIHDFHEVQKVKYKIKRVIKEDVNDSTAINYLRELLTKIKDKFVRGYTSLTTNKKQRDAYKYFLALEIKNMLENEVALNQANAPDDVEDIEKLVNMKESLSRFLIFEEQKIDLEISDGKPDEDFFIDPDQKEEEEEIDPEEEKRKTEQEKYDPDTLTGKDKASVVAKEIGSQIVDTYNRIHNEEDKKTFTEYLLKNLELHMQNAEEEMEVVDHSEMGSEESFEDTESFGNDQELDFEQGNELDMNQDTEKKDLDFTNI